MRSRPPLRLSVESGFVRVLALDVGSSSARAQLYDERAREVGDPARQAYEPSLGRDGSAELDADELVRAAGVVLDSGRSRPRRARDFVLLAQPAPPRW